MSIAGAARALASHAHAVWPPRPRQAALVLALGVAALGLRGVWFYSSLPRRLPTALDWRAAAALLTRDGRPGDAVALAPWWAERAREVLPSSLPVLAIPHPAQEELLGVRRVWLVELPDAPGFERAVEQHLLERAVAVDGPLRLGALEVTRVDLQRPLLPLAFLPDRLSSAEVKLGDVRCVAQRDGAFHCGGAVTVARGMREVDLLPRACVVGWTSGERRLPLTIAFPAVPLGASLRGHAGIVGEAALDGDGPLRVSVQIDGREVGGVDIAEGDGAWRGFAVDTSRDAGRPRSVTFTVSDGSSEGRPFCFDASALP